MVDAITVSMYNENDTSTFSINRLAKPNKIYKYNENLFLESNLLLVGAQALRWRMDLFLLAANVNFRLKNMD